MSVSQDTARLIRFLQLNGPTPSGQLVESLGISRATLSRRLRLGGSAVVVIGRGRATQLAARRSGHQQPIPLYQVTETGSVDVVGQLKPVEPNQWYLQADNYPNVLCHGEFREGIFPGWPWFLEDLRPSGFLGRQFARHMSTLFNLNQDPRVWTDLQLAEVLSRFGSNLTGNFIVGAIALTKFQQIQTQIVEGYYQNNTPAVYPEKAELALNEGEDFGSSAGGEQAKFTTVVTDAALANLPREVIVKFSPLLQTESARRWADLLWAEHSANQVLKNHGFAVAQTQMFESGGRAFLESTRFDRTPGGGRKGIVTLRSLDAAYIGQGDGNWAQSASLLQTAGIIDHETCGTLIALHCFGTMIQNTDMHSGNISFFLQNNFPLQLCPVYDMLPMRFRPTATGEIRPPQHLIHPPRPEFQSTWSRMLPVALEYWQQLSCNEAISASFQAIAKDAISELNKTASIFRNG